MSNKQKENLESMPLLDPNGAPLSPGFSRRNLFDFNRQHIAGSKWRLKEWDYYQVSDGRYLVLLNFFNISLFSCLSAEFCDLKTGKSWSDAVIEPLTIGKHPLSPAADADYTFTYHRSGRSCRMEITGCTRHLQYTGKVWGKPFEIDLTAETLPEQESLTTVTPFSKKNCFFFTQKLNCMATFGSVRVADMTYQFAPENTFTVMDWGRGVWPWSNSWYWSNGSTRIDGKLFGFELTWGFGDDRHATATALFYDGKCHKLGPVHLVSDPETNHSWMKPWHFMDDEGRLDLTMTPFFDHRIGVIVLKLVGMTSHQVHGLFNGYVVLDDGKRLEIRDMYAFAEKVHNRW